MDISESIDQEDVDKAIDAITVLISKVRNKQLSFGLQMSDKRVLLKMKCHYMLKLSLSVFFISESAIAAEYGLS